MSGTIRRPVCLAALALAALLICVTAPGSPSFAAEPDYGNYRILGHDNNSGEPIIGAVSVSDFGAKGDGVTDDTTAILSAIRNAQRNTGPCTVYFPAGVYRITRPGINVYSNMTLRGQWNDPLGSATGPQTVFLADYDPVPAAKEGEPGDALFLLAGQASVRDFAVYYPRQSMEKVLPYNYTVWATNHTVSVQNVTLYNSYRGIYCGGQYGGSAHFVSNIHGTILREGVVFDWNYEVSSLTRLNFSASYWHSYDSAVSEQAVRDYAKQNAVAVRLGKVDDVLVYGLNANPEEFACGIKLFYNEDIPNPPRIAYGLLMQLNGARVDAGDKQEPNPPHILEVDGVPRSEEYRYAFSPDRYPGSENLFLPQAAGDGVADDSAAIQAAMDAAGSAGGGTVFLPAGKYRITRPLAVPENVEVRGAWDSPHCQSPTEMLVSFGENQPEQAVFTLSPFSGLHGLTVRIPSHSYAAITPYPWVARGGGKAVWVEYLTLVNCYNGIDFASAKCDDFLIKGVWGTAVNTGVRAGGGSERGRLEYNMFTFGTWYEDCGRGDDGAISDYTYANAAGYRFGDLADSAAFSSCIFGLKYGMVFEAQNGGQPENMSLFRCLLDEPFGMACLKLDAGDDLTFIGLSTGIHPDENRDSCLIEAGAGFTGRALVYGQNTWGGGENRLNGRRVSIYDADSADVEVIDHNFSFAVPKYRPDGEEEKNPVRIGLIVGLSTAGAIAAGAAVSAAVLVRKRKRRNG